MLEGFDELVWDGIYWSGQIELPAWQDFDLRWFAETDDEEEPWEDDDAEPDEDSWKDDPDLDMSPEEIEELEEAAKTDPGAREILEMIKAVHEMEDPDDGLEPGMVDLGFSVVETGELQADMDAVPPPPHPQQVAAATYARDNAEHVKSIILADALDMYKSFKPQAEEILSRKMPDLKKPDDLKDHLRLVGINPLAIVKDGESYMAYYFTCTWDLDEGMPYVLHRDRIVLVGLTEPEADEQSLLDDGGTRLGESKG